MVAMFQKTLSTKVTEFPRVALYCQDAFAWYPLRIELSGSIPRATFDLLSVLAVLQLNKVESPLFPAKSDNAAH